MYTINEDINIQLADLYAKMEEEIQAEVTALGGSIEDFSPDDKMVSIDVPPENQELMQKILGDVVAKYEKRRKEILSQDAFRGVQSILDGDDN